ncbi:diguanylate cyclase response regulator [Sulfitobacter sp. EhC04]|uniref:diguanylate cyclase domain-containing protein n=1 Tax=Sulfitobacter sp. EhC04 TaxID=1849168 RepID=UPI0007F3E7B3|nr:diguanylate cyclase [Sulfitobacter sp. EhC04]OAN74402.1 diguanylate cyclase response regulator [Sulfitobacter sp. EhC04]
MQGKILIADPIVTNRIVLKVKLASAFYTVVQAGTISEAVEIAASHAPDLIISALELPDGSAADLCRQLAKWPQTRQIGILALAGAIDHATRMATLESGVHDVLVKPYDETLLLSRVRSLIRTYNAEAEWQIRDDTTRALGFAEAEVSFAPQGEFVLVGQDRATIQRWATGLRPLLGGKITLASGKEVMSKRLDGAPPDVFVLVIGPERTSAEDRLQLISALRSNARTRHCGILVLQTRPDATLATNALDLGADDLMIDGFDAAELALRLKALLRRKRMSEKLRQTVRTGLEAAVYDPLTGLYNRRYAMPHLMRVAEQARGTRRPFAVMVCDLDHFKRVNDLYGHASGDAVLIEVAKRLRGSLRAMDMVARIGGEEFMIVMPATTLPAARKAALRLCDLIGERPFDLPGSPEPVRITISIGMALDTLPQSSSETAEVSAQDAGARLMDQADKALYAAKVKGRNQVKLGRPAA